MKRADLTRAVSTASLLFVAGVAVCSERRGFAEDPGARRLVSVAELTEIGASAKGKHDGEVATVMEHLQLTERLNSVKLAELSAELPGTKSRSALLVLGDESVFLNPPAGEISNIAAPDTVEQRRMLTLVVEYLNKTVPKLPDFTARRTTISFESKRTEHGQSGITATASTQLQRKGESRATVLYRGHREVVLPQGGTSNKGAQGLTTWGTFGPILSTVIGDAAHGDISWSRWEEGSAGTIAVFRYEVPKEASHYEVSSEGISGGIQEDRISDRSAYHGEIGIDSASGTILRLTLQADILIHSLDVPFIGRADVMVEYGPVDIGGKHYTCPSRSVSFSTGYSPGFESLTGIGAPREVTRLNDVVFDGYHVFRSEMRILP